MRVVAKWKKKIVIMLLSVMIGTAFLTPVVSMFTVVTVRADVGSWIDSDSPSVDVDGGETQNMPKPGEAGDGGDGGGGGILGTIGDYVGNLMSNFIENLTGAIVSILGHFVFGPNEVLTGGLLTEVRFIILSPITTDSADMTKANKKFLGLGGLLYFNLAGKNIYGSVGAFGYTVLRGLCYVWVAISLAFILLRAAIGTGSGYTKDQLKSQMLQYFLSFAALSFWPNILDVMIYVRNCIMAMIYNSNFYKAVWGMVTSGDNNYSFLQLAGGTLEKISGLQSLTNLTLLIGYQVLIFYFIIMYISIALTMALLMIIAPLVFVVAPYNKQLLSQWFMNVLGCLSVPIIDFLLLLCVANIPGSHKYLQMFAVMNITTMRGLFRQILGLGSSAVGEMFGVGTLMAAMQLGKAAARVAAGLATGGASEAAALAGAAAEADAAVEAGEVAGEAADAVTEGAASMGAASAGKGQALDNLLDDFNNSGSDGAAASESSSNRSSDKSDSSSSSGNSDKIDGSGTKMETMNSGSGHTSAATSATDDVSTDGSFSSDSSEATIDGPSTSSTASGTGSVNVSEDIVGDASETSSTSAPSVAVSDIESEEGSSPGGTKGSRDSSGSTESSRAGSASESDGEKRIVNPSGNTVMDARRRNLENMKAIREDTAADKARMGEINLGIAQNEQARTAEKGNLGRLQQEKTEIESAIRTINSDLKRMDPATDGQKMTELEAERDLQLNPLLEDVKSDIATSQQIISDYDEAIAGQKTKKAALQGRISGNQDKLQEASRVESGFAAQASGYMGQRFDEPEQYDRAQHLAAQKARLADVSNFERPEFSQNMTHRQKAAMYRERAQQIRRRTNQRAAMSAVGGYLGASAMIALGPRAMAMGAASGMDFGGSAADMRHTREDVNTARNRFNEAMARLEQFDGGSGGGNADGGVESFGSPMPTPPSGIGGGRRAALTSSSLLNDGGMSRPISQTGATASGRSGRRVRPNGTASVPIPEMRPLDLNQMAPDGSSNILVSSFDNISSDDMLYQTTGEPRVSPVGSERAGVSGASTPTTSATTIASNANGSIPTSPMPDVEGMTYSGQPNVSASYSSGSHRSNAPASMDPSAGMSVPTQPSGFAGNGSVPPSSMDMNAGNLGVAPMTSYEEAPSMPSAGSSMASSVYVQPSDPGTGTVQTPNSATYRTGAVSEPSMPSAGGSMGAVYAQPSGPFGGGSMPQSPSYVGANVAGVTPTTMYEPESAPSSTTTAFVPNQSLFVDNQQAQYGPMYTAPSVPVSGGGTSLGGGTYQAGSVHNASPATRDYQRSQILIDALGMDYDRKLQNTSYASYQTSTFERLRTGLNTLRASAEAGAPLEEKIALYEQLRGEVAYLEGVEADELNELMSLMEFNQFLGE